MFKQEQQITVYKLKHEKFQYKQLRAEELKSTKELKKLKQEAHKTIINFFMFQDIYNEDQVIANKLDMTVECFVQYLNELPPKITFIEKIVNHFNNVDLLLSLSSKAYETFLLIKKMQNNPEEKLSPLSCYTDHLPARREAEEILGHIEQIKLYHINYKDVFATWSYHEICKFYEYSINLINEKVKSMPFDFTQYQINWHKIDTSKKDFIETLKEKLELLESKIQKYIDITTNLEEYELTKQWNLQARRLN